ncbi:uncharacterized protein [Bemisia tabaci]|uniref:uncharacterized protein isoform X7 n=1 Tax=Bemisia tabaci TaxID=7038 RepID=UPI003B288974
MSGDVTKVLPPRFNGQTTGCLQMNVKTIRWLFDSPGQVVVATSWWGDDSKCLFMPKEDNQPIRNTVQNRSYIFNICSSREKFLTYLQYHKRLKFLVLKEKNVLGVGTLENLSQIFHNRHYDNFVDVYDKDSQLIADVHVCFNLTIFPENSPRSFIQRIDSHENDLNPRRTVPFYSQAEKLRVGFGERADEEPRCPVFSHLDDTRKLLEYLQADEEKKKMSLERRCPVYSHLDDERKLLDYLKSEERKKNVSLLDITNLCLTDESDETNFALSSPSSKLSSTSVKSCDSRSTTECLQDYLNGFDMCKESRMKALQLTKKSTSSLINFAEVSDTEEVMRVFNDRSLSKGELTASTIHSKYSRDLIYLASKESSPDKVHPVAKFPALSNSDVNFRFHSSPPTKQKSFKAVGPSKSAGVSTKINFYRISLDRIIFNSDGLRKLNGFHSVKHQQQNCPHGTYIIQYQLSKVDPKFRLEKTWPVRHISRRTLANGVIYGENDVYKVRDLRSEDVVTSFKISCQFLNQRLPMFLGDTESLVIKEDTKCSLFIKAVNGITIGKLDIQINVGSSIESLPPPETFSEVCREEIDELIPSSNFESFRAKSNASKYLILKAQLRNASDEKLKNVPSAQYNSYVDNFNSPCITPLETCNVASLQHPPSQPTSYMLSDLHSSSGDFTDEHSTTPQLDALNSKTNARSHVGAQQYFNQNSSRTNDSADFHNAAPKKYAIVTHEFNVIIRNFDHHQDYVVSYVFPESTSHENGKVFSSWSEVSISTNLSRPFFISLPYGVSLKNFLKKTGKKSIIFYFKQPSQNKTSAKPEERLVLQVWCKRYQNEFAGPDRVRDRCLGFVFCNLTVLMRNFRYAGGWHQIISPSGKNNGQIQILVKPLQSIDFVKDLECEVLVHSESNLINDLQPYNFYLNAAVTKQKNDVSSKELLSQEILELENQIKELQLSHKKRSMKAESSKIIAGKNAEKNSPISSGKGTAKKIARFLSFRRKSRKHKSLPISEDVSGSVSSGSVIESENIRIAKNNSDKYDSAPVSSNESESPCSESACDGKEEVKKSSSIFVRSFSFKLRKSGRKSKVHQNALLQNLPLYQKNSPQNLDEFDKCMNINSI